MSAVHYIISINDSEGCKAQTAMFGAEIRRILWTPVILLGTIWRCGQLTAPSSLPHAGSTGGKEKNCLLNSEYIRTSVIGEILGPK
jgi:hypothetical protein